MTSRAAGNTTAHPARPADAPASYRDVFRIAEYRALWSANALSLLGDQLARVAIAILVYEQTRAPFLTAFAYSLTYLPPIIGGPLLAALSDLFPRRRVLICCDLIRVPLAAALALPQLPFPALCGLVLGLVLAGVPFTAARAALMPDILPGDKLVIGSAVSSTTSLSAQVAGFAGGAAAVGALGPRGALLLNAATFALSALIVVAAVKPRPRPERVAGRRPILAGARHGARLVFSSPERRTLVLLGWVAGCYLAPEALAVPYAHALGGGPLATGLLLAASPAGMAVSVPVLARLVKPPTRMRHVGSLAIFACIPLTACLLQPPLPAVIALWGLSGIGSSYQVTAAAKFLQSLPDAGRAAAFGIAQSGILAAQGLGFLAGGAAAQIIGPAATVGIAGIMGTCLAAVLTVAWRRIQRHPIAPPAAGHRPAEVS